eukprot:2419346-Heterocapsa_arctica.AAC.1
MPRHLISGPRVEECRGEASKVPSFFEASGSSASGTKPHGVTPSMEKGSGAGTDAQSCPEQPTSTATTPVAMGPESIRAMITLVDLSKAYDGISPRRAPWTTEARAGVHQGDRMSALTCNLFTGGGNGASHPFVPTASLHQPHSPFTWRCNYGLEEVRGSKGSTGGGEGKLPARCAHLQSLVINIREHLRRTRIEIASSRESGGVYMTNKTIARTSTGKAHQDRAVYQLHRVPEQRSSWPPPRSIDASKTNVPLPREQLDRSTGRNRRCCSSH